jgi:SAM-dependent methyltransferase
MTGQTPSLRNMTSRRSRVIHSGEQDVSALRSLARRIGLRRVVDAGMGAVLRGHRVHCPCCGSSFRRSSGRRGPNRVCWTCGSVERHRVLMHHFAAHPELLRPGMSILHIAPERAIARRLRQIPDVRYVGGDLTAECGPERIDVTDLRFEDATFDAVVCSHVLEHVPDDRKAMSEIRRVLKPTGWALLPVPDVRGDVTDEDPTIADPEEQLRRFGQADHVRHYGWDYVTRLEETGLEVEVISAEELLSETTIRRDRLRSFGRVPPIFIARPAPAVSTTEPSDVRSADVR